MKKKSFCSVMAAVTIAALCMVGCGSTTEVTSTTEESVIEESVAETTESVETTVETTESAETETSETEETIVEAVPYAEEKGIEYSDERSFVIRGIAVLTDENYINVMDYDGITIAARDDEITYTFEDATVSEPDSDGNVIITVHAAVVLPMDITYDASVTHADFYTCCAYKIPILFDIYSGLAFSSGTMFNDVETAVTTDISYDGIVYTINVVEEQEFDWTSGDWVQQTATTAMMEKVCSVNYTYTLTVPQDYDGLCFAFETTSDAVYLSETTTSDEANVEQTLEELLAESELTLDDVTAYVKVSDLLAE